MSDSSIIGNVETAVEIGYFAFNDTADQAKFHERVQARIDDNWKLHGPLIVDIIRSKISGEVHLYWHQPLIRLRKLQTYAFYDARKSETGTDRVHTSISHTKAEARCSFDSATRYFKDKTQATLNNCVCFSEEEDPHVQHPITIAKEALDRIPIEQEEKTITTGTKQTYIFCENIGSANEKEILRVKAESICAAWFQFFTVLQPTLSIDSIRERNIYFKIA